MARQYAPIYTNVWQDDDFKKLSGEAQRIYVIAMSQHNTSWCGVVSFTARRWASFASNTTARLVTKAVAELVDAGYVLLDEETEELWVRSFVKHNKVMDQPKLVAAAKRQLAEVHSEAIRRGIAKAYPGLLDTPSEGVAWTPVLGVDGEVSGVLEDNELSSHSTPTPPPAVLDEYRAEAERQADGWLRKDPTSIIDRAAWVAKRMQTLVAKHGTAGLPKATQVLHVVCENPDCRKGWDYGRDTECVACLREKAS